MKWRDRKKNFFQWKNCAKLNHTKKIKVRSCKKTCQTFPWHLSQFPCVIDGCLCKSKKTSPKWTHVKVVKIWDEKRWHDENVCRRVRWDMDAKNRKLVIFLFLSLSLLTPYYTPSSVHSEERKEGDDNRLVEVLRMTATTCLTWKMCYRRVDGMFWRRFFTLFYFCLDTDTHEFSIVRISLFSENEKRVEWTFQLWRGRSARRTEDVDRSAGRNEWVVVVVQNHRYWRFVGVLFDLLESLSYHLCLASRVEKVTRHKHNKRCNLELLSCCASSDDFFIIIVSRHEIECTHRNFPSI